jgi:dTDP-4-dehydrorhamnose reductase
MKILLFGKNGQVGWELQRALAPLGDIVAPEKSQGGDLADLECIARTIEAAAPDIIVNAAAYTAVDKAESDRAAAVRINVEAPAVMAREAKKRGAWMVHYSTDYVFDGGGARPWREEDKTGPLNVYGATKLEGEQAIQSAGGNHLIFRTSWVYAARGANFAKAMLRLGGERESLDIVADQFGAPTGAELIADVTAHAIRVVQSRPHAGGLYHLAAAGETNWYDYAGVVFDCAREQGAALKITPGGLLPMAAADFPALAKRPYNSRLDNGKLTATFGLSMPDWQQGVRRMLSEILE